MLFRQSSCFRKATSAGKQLFWENSCPGSRERRARCTRCCDALSYRQTVASPWRSAWKPWNQNPRSTLKRSWTSYIYRVETTYISTTCTILHIWRRYFCNIIFQSGVCMDQSFILHDRNQGRGGVRHRQYAFNPNHVQYRAFSLLLLSKI